MSGEEGLLTTQVCQYLGIKRSNLSHISSRQSLSMLTLSQQNRNQLRIQGLIKAVGIPPKFLPRDSVKALVKIVNTPEAWTINKAGLYLSIGSHSKTSPRASNDV
jgi:hypothetical protein